MTEWVRSNLDDNLWHREFEMPNGYHAVVQFFATDVVPWNITVYKPIGEVWDVDPVRAFLRDELLVDEHLIERRLDRFQWKGTTIPQSVSFPIMSNPKMEPLAPVPCVNDRVHRRKNILGGIVEFSTSEFGGGTQAREAFAAMLRRVATAIETSKSDQGQVFTGVDSGPCGYWKLVESQDSGGT